MFNLGSLLRREDTAKAPRIVEKELAGDALLEAVVCELLDATAGIAAVSSGLNAVAKGKPPQVLATLRNFVPSQPALLSIGRLFNGGGDGEHLAELYLRLVFREIATASEDLKSVLDEGGNHGGAMALTHGARKCAASWQRICTLAIDAINAIETEVRWRFSGRYSPNAVTLSNLLRQCAAGASPCVDDKGYVKLPALSHRRRMRRFSIQQRCIVYWRGTRVGADAKDVSAGGIGLAGAPEMPLKDQVVIELESGRQLRGFVVWSGGGRLGIQFAEQLAPNDPLFCA